MGERVERSALKVGHSGDVRRRLEDSVTALAAMLNQGCFAHHEDSVGTELELDLVDPLGLPRLVNDDVLARLARPDLQQELGRFNIEFNLRPRRLTSGVLYAMESEFAATLRTRGLEDLGVRLVAVGTLPTAGPEELMRDRLSSPSRYELLARRMRAERHGPVAVRIDGVESLTFVSPSVAPEAAATSLQLHLRVPPDRFASYYNAAQAIAGAQLAAGANSPYLLGRQLWQETRVPLCEQVLDTRRRREIRAGAPPRAWLGDRWIRGPVELFDSIVRSVPPLLPTLAAESPFDGLTSGKAPRLPELRLHNGTVWRWNRPVYDVQDGQPHLRIENRVLPSGPGALDMTANAAFYLGLVRALSDADRPLWSTTPFALVERNLYAAARLGLDATLHWDGTRVPAAELILDVLLPLAETGLDTWGIPSAERDRYLSVIAQRVSTGQTGARWQTTTVDWIERHGRLGRRAALREMTRRYAEHARTGAPVHHWPIP